MVRVTVSVQSAFILCTRLRTTQLERVIADQDLDVAQGARQASDLMELSHDGQLEPPQSDLEAVGVVQEQ